MATMMAMKVVGFSFQLVIGKLEKMLAEEAALLAGVEDDVRYIVAELRSITTFLTTMSTRNLDDQQQNWVQEVREVAYDAEDLIDEFNCRLRSTPYDERGIKGFFKHFLRRIKSLKPRHGIASKLKKLKSEVEEIRKRYNRYSHPNEAPSSGTTTSLDMTDKYTDPRIIGHFDEEAQLVGINQSKDKLIGWVMDDKRLELSVISLVGFGGLGKTTLTRTVYNDPVTAGGHFQSRAWIAVSQNYSIRELLIKIIRQISVTEQQIRDVFGCQDNSLNTEQLLKMMEESQLVQSIRGHLHGKRFLVVFDDVWSTEAWESLRIVLPSTGKKGSRVIVTTRIEEVANTSCSRNPQFIFEVSPLSPEQSWELFCRRVFEAPDYNCPRKLEKVGIEILQKCNGLPLAIVTIGGLLASKKLEEYWKDLHDHLRMEKETNNRLSKINQILVLSYNDLPYDLKPCFLFLGIFPEDYEIRRKRLMRRWIAEGIVTGVGSLSAEKVAERYFDQLVSRSLVQPSQFDDRGTVKSCRVHDMMLDVILSISRKENFAVLLNEHPMIPPQHQKIRRLSWHGGSSRLVRDTDLAHLRSFTAFGEVVPLKDYRKQRQLRSIDLEVCSSSFDLHPKSFSKLFLLKHLSLRGSRISVLPDSIGDLQNLEFLDMRQTRITELPNTIVKLQKLVYLFAGPHQKQDVSAYLGERELLKVPKEIGKLKRLAAFGMAYADSVQSLQEIGELVDLQELAISFRFHELSHRMLEEISALLSKLNGSLRSLKILHLECVNLKLDGVASPPLLLCKLLIRYELGRLPPWFASLKHVVKITLWDTLLHPDDLQVLRNLPALVKLNLGFRSFINDDENLVFDRRGFAKLKFLEIEHHNVSFNVGAVRSLEILKIIFPYESVNGIEHLLGLREVHIDSRYPDRIEMVKKSAADNLNRPKCFASLFRPVDGLLFSVDSMH